MIFAATFLFGSFYFYSEIGRHPVPDHPFQETYKTFANFFYAAYTAEIRPPDMMNKTTSGLKLSLLHKFYAIILNLF